MIILLHLLNDNRDRVSVFYWSSECDVLLPVVCKYEPYTYTYKLGCSGDNEQIFNNNKKKYCKVLATKNRQRRLINSKLDR